MKKVAFIFPGQGSQQIGMGRDFFNNSDIAKEMFSQASQRLGIDFEELLFKENPKIGQTEFTQPAILLVSSIANAIFTEKFHIKPTFVLGHSLGEFSALVSVKAINYLDAIELVHKRGKFMADACLGLNTGMMALIGLDDLVVEKICEKKRAEGAKIWPANYNMNKQIVLAGSKEDLQNSISTFKQEGAKKTVILDMSVSSHCELLQSAVENLKPYLEEYLKDEFEADVISNVTANEYNTKEEAIELLSEQLVNPVKYKHSILSRGKDLDFFIEFGNGTVLKGLNRKITKTPTLNVYDFDSLNKTIEVLND